MKELLIIAGPCVVESQEMTEKIAKEVEEIMHRIHLPGFVFKASYKKANRTKLDSFTGLDEIDALKILNKIHTDLIVPVITDIHESADAVIAGNFVDILQIPAFLCRQTDLILAAAKNANVVNIKKGQWMSPDSMKYAVEKARSVMPEFGKVWVTERGSSFGYSHNVVDFTGIPIMKQFADKVIVDCTHSVQVPNSGSTTGGNPEMIETIALAAVAAGADGLFFEVHPDPKNSPSDAASILDIKKLEDIVIKCMKVREAIQ